MNICSSRPGPTFVDWSGFVFLEGFDCEVLIHMSEVFVCNLLDSWCVKMVVEFHVMGVASL